MKDKVIQIEIVLNFINTLFGKAVYTKNSEIVNQLSDIRHSIYYSEYEYEKVIENLKGIEEILKKDE